MKRALCVFATLLFACSTNEGLAPVPTPAPSASSAPPTPVVTTTGTLDLDTVTTADVTLGEHVDGTLDVKLKLGRGGGVLDPAVELMAKGKVSRFPEANTTLYSAKVRAPAFPGGRCGSDPVSLSLTLRRVGTNARVSGAVTAYCGDGVFEGAPVQVLRMTGKL